MIQGTEPRDASEIGAQREYKIHASDNQNGLRTMNNLFYFDSPPPPVVISLSLSLSRLRVGKTKNKVSWWSFAVFLLDSILD